ncbi:MAG: SUMF1/EgtB/PvdO family nonheme iron enzyme [Sedimentisphaerales bacterium]
MKRLIVYILLVLQIVLAVDAAELPATKLYTNSLGMKFVRIEPGTFKMGYGQAAALSDEILNATEHNGRNIKLSAFGRFGDYDEHPTHEVTISKPFYMSVTEVTNAQYEKFDPLHMHVRGKRGFSIDNDEAVVFVSWYEAKAFCDWLSKKEGLPYRLPTEAEWEYACRAGTATQFFTGDILPNEFLKNPGNSWYPCPTHGRGREEVVPLHVGKTRPNPWGLYDMHGNVEEWCLDWYGPYEKQYQIDPVGRIDGDFKVTRGGSHGTVAYYLRSANRMGTLPQDKSFMIGFRVVLGKMPKTKPLPKIPKPPYQRKVKQDIPPDVVSARDPDKPYFCGPRNYVKIPAGSNGPLFSAHNHDPAIVECPNGDLLAIWYTCVSERGRELGLAASRLRYGQGEWELASPFWDAPDRNDHAPALWRDGGKIYHFVGLSTAATWGPLAVVMRTSTDNGATWAKARLIVPEHQRRNQVAESVFRTQQGYIVLACDATPAGRGGTALHISKDNGQTWSDPGGTIAGIHAGVAQLDDGRLIAFGRGDNIDGQMPKSISTDMGKTWTYIASGFPPIGGGQRLVLLRLREGPLFFASFANGRPAVMVTDVSGKKRAVRGLFAALSYDGGQTWPYVRLITDDGPKRKAKTSDGREFTMSRTTAEPRGYLSVCQGQNGLIHLISSWNHYVFNLKWLQTPPPAID